MIDTENGGVKFFDDWNGVKKGLDKVEKFPRFSEGDIWWCGVGENVGVEINGKSRKFSRPVLVLKKLSRHGFMGVPLTSQPHEGSWYVPFMFRGRVEIAVLAQAKSMSVCRLYSRMGQVPEDDLELVRRRFVTLYGNIGGS